MFAGNPAHAGQTRESCFASERAMPPIVKENETLSSTAETTPRPASAASLPAESASKPQPVALEVAVTVNGARTVEGSDKREPFSESTKTVLVFGNGAVIRLLSSVSPGQLLFLTNEKTKKEVVCQVVKSKNYRNVSGYVELEFTESVVGFWGMRFPGDRLGPAQPAASTPVSVAPSSASGTPAVPRRAVPRIETPAVSVAPKIMEAKPPAPTNATRDLKPKRSEVKFGAPPASLTELPSAQKPEAPVASAPIGFAEPASLTPDFTAYAAPVKPLAPTSSTFDLPRNPEVRASIFAPPPQASAAPPAVEAVSLPPDLEVKPPAPAPPVLELPRSTNERASIFAAPQQTPATLHPVLELKPSAPPTIGPSIPAVASDPETEALKQHTARLQEQLSSLLFAEAPAAKPLPISSPARPHEEAKPVDLAAKLLEFAKTDATPAPVVKSAEPERIAPLPVTASFDEEELKIPAWLEPLTRNAAAPVSTQELIEREKAKRLAEQPKLEEIAAEPLAAESPAAVAEENTAEAPVPAFSGSFLVDEPLLAEESSPKKSNKGLLIAAIAAAVVLLAGSGAWYMRQQTGGVHVNAASAPQMQTPPAPGPSQTLQSQPLATTASQGNTPSQTAVPALNNAALQTKSAANPEGLVPAAPSAVAGHNQETGSIVATRSPNTVDSGSALSASAQPKKPVLGEVHLATPIASQRKAAPLNGDADPGAVLNDDQPESNEASLGTGLAVNTKQPDAPAPAAPVGGDVKQAKAISTVAPVYPILAKSQHIAGDVRIDALIDANGRVTAMKIISGSTLLHQAAMDALRQWKYQPATLDGKPVAMHLTVTLQFRLQ
jgi:TonB family protein